LKFIKLLILLNSVITCTFAFSKSIEVYDCVYSSPPFVVFQLKNGRESCSARSCISEVKCQSNVAEVKVRAVCPGIFGKDKVWHCPEADDCVFDNSIKISKGTVRGNESHLIQDNSNPANGISK